MTLLVVDDYAAFRVSLRELLIAAGYTVVLAVDGLDALRKMQIVPVGMAITDIHMPNMDGISLRNKLRATAETKDMPVLFISGIVDDMTHEAVVDPNLEGFYEKGRPISEILSWIKYLTTPVSDRPSTPPGYSK